MRTRHNYKNLRSWPPKIEIADTVFSVVKDFPQYEKFDLISQINRCSVSIPNNMAKGFAKTGNFELTTQLILAFNNTYINVSKLKVMDEKQEEFPKMTMGFQNKL